MRLALFLLASIALSDVSMAQERTVKPITDLTLLASALNLPATPAEACFIETALGNDRLGPADRILHVVMKFDQSAMESIRTRSQKIDIPGSADLRITLLESCWKKLKLPPLDFPHDRQGARIFLDQRRNASAWFRSPYLDGVIFETSLPGVLIGQFRTR